MPVFDSYRDYRSFATTIAKKRRYFREPGIEAFLQRVLETSASRRKTLKAGTYLCRARLDHGWEPQDVGDGQVEEFPAPLGSKDMKPLLDQAREGRANPKGIPYLYLATHKDTAIAEVRPWIGQFVSLGSFQLQREITVIDCVTGDRSIGWYMEEPEPAERERAVWRDIDRAFSEPVSRSDDLADYAATQVVAELFRHVGLDGIAYGSALGAGHNVVLFDVDVAQLIVCQLFQIKQVTFKHSESAAPYHVAEPLVAPKD